MEERHSLLEKVREDVYSKTEHLFNGEFTDSPKINEDDLIKMIMLNGKKRTVIPQQMVRYDNDPDI